MYLELHDISTGRCSHQTRPHILGMFVQNAHISWVLIVVHHLQAESKRHKRHSFDCYSGEPSTDLRWIHPKPPEKVFCTSLIGGRLSGEGQSLQEIKFCPLCKRHWNKLIRTGFHCQRCILFPPDSPPPPSPQTCWVTVTTTNGSACSHIHPTGELQYDFKNKNQKN